MTPDGFIPWEGAGWRGWLATGIRDDTGRWLVAAASGGGRRSRHARTVRLVGAEGVVWVKSYPAPAGRRATRALRMGRLLAAAGFAVPTVLLAVWRDDAAVVVTRDVGGLGGTEAIAACAPSHATKRTLLRRVGAEVGRLHAAGFVHGDLVPPNVQVVGQRLVLLDHDRSRRGWWLVALAGRRNLVQLGRFVVPGVTLTDRARVLAAYAHARGLSRRRRRRLAWWIMRKTTMRRCVIDRIPPAAARRAGYRALMRSGGPFDHSTPAGASA